MSNYTQLHLIMPNYMKANGLNLWSSQWLDIRQPKKGFVYTDYNQQASYTVYAPNFVGPPRNGVNKMLLETNKLSCGLRAIMQFCLPEINKLYDGSSVLFLTERWVVGYD